MISHRNTIQTGLKSLSNLCVCRWCLRLGGQLTTLSEPLSFRPSSFLVTIWLMVTSLHLRRTHQPASIPESSVTSTQWKKQRGRALNPAPPLLPLVPRKNPQGRSSFLTVGGFPVIAWVALFSSSHRFPRLSKVIALGNSSSEATISQLASKSQA